MAKQETQVELKLPTAASGDDLNDEARRVTVNLTADGAMLVAGETLDAEMLGRKLAVERAKSEDLEVRLRCDRTVPYGRIKPVMRECLKNDVWKVTFAVAKQKE